MSEWELICGHAWKAQFANSAFFVGFLVGAGVFGMLSDRYGESEAWSHPAVASIAQVAHDLAVEPALTVRCQDTLNTAAIPPLPCRPKGGTPKLMCCCGRVWHCEQPVAGLLVGETAAAHLEQHLAGHHAAHVE